MKHSNKPFDKSLHDDNDQIAKNAVKRYFERVSALHILEGDKYGVDLVLHDQIKVVATIEVERRQWKTECPFDTIRVPKRKDKFFNSNCYLFAVSQDCTIALWCSGNQIIRSEVVNVNNRMMVNEPFFNVPIKLWNRVVL